jgi:hypothetical protein
MSKLLRYKGVLYKQVEANQHPLDEAPIKALVTNIEVAAAHLDEVVSDAQKLISEANTLKKALTDSVREIAQSLKSSGELDSKRIQMLDPDVREDHFTIPLHSMEKSNRVLNYTVDAAISAITSSIEQVDSMTDDMGAALEAQNAPGTSSELVSPAFMSTNPAEDVPTM